ncbi:STAS domain-containing protein [Pseudonocardia sp. CA-107938]|uniref:STAS domain-containing protein n=1 Tax=Pseudonocardia sp. CA-107938 TaxID=3240021 RepID=UPI003D8A40CD
MHPFIALTAPRPDVQVVALRGALDGVTAVRVARIVEARARLAGTGGVVTRHIVVDLRGTTSVTATAAAELDRAATRARRRGLHVHVVGPDPTADIESVLQRTADA